VAFSRAKYVPYGPPSGGGGGRGGDVYIRAVSDMRSLARVPGRAEAGMGGHGRGEWHVGAPGKDVTLSVPVGTLLRVRKIEPDEDDEMDEQRVLRAQYDEDLMHRYRRKGVRGRPRSPRLKLEPERANEEDEEEQEDEEADLDEETRQAEIAAHALERSQRDAMWRHYPGGSGGGGATGAMTAQGVIEEADADIALQRREFAAAEERLAAALWRERGEQEERERVEWRRYSGEEQKRLLRQEAEDADLQTPMRIIDLDRATPADSPGVLLARGGSGGFGNPFFLSTGAISRSPKLATRGAWGERVHVELELKSPADVGLVGLPNAGKSTLLRALTSAGRAGVATAKVGAYEFTTLSPNVGVLRLGDKGQLIGAGHGDILESSEAQAAQIQARESTAEEEVARLTLADLPGLIAGASANRGLGHLFLRHAERCRALLYVVDVSEAQPAPWEHIATLREELEAYAPGLSERCVAVVANKCDVLGPPIPNIDSPTEATRSSREAAQEKLRRLGEEARRLHDGRPLKIYAVSAKHRLGVEAVASAMRDAVTDAETAERGEDASRHKWV
jgi:GTPase involved in cell partitioning and DNA repair